jgi:AcrR family transcriptional regulator
MKERILETADRLFYLQGIRAVGVDTIAAEIGISKRTLYNHFPSKDALIAAYLERRFTQLRPSDKPPVEQILGTFDRWSGLCQQGFSRLPVRQRGRRTGSRGSVGQEDRGRLQGKPPLWFRDLLLQLMSPMRRAWRRSSRCSSTARSRRTWCATIRRWRARPRKPRACCWECGGEVGGGPAPGKTQRMKKQTT